MATTTNFGWDTPDDTDLVKDGAAAIRTLGNSIDTSFVDLKGGTSGQILSKNSNTDLDYTWIDNDTGDITGVTAGTGISGGGTTGTVTVTNSMATAIDAKGDLIVGTGADTFDRLAVGTNDQYLVADSTASTGLKWATLSAGAYTQIATGTLSSTVVNITSIPATYQALRLVIRQHLPATDNRGINLYFNADTNTRYNSEASFSADGFAFSGSSFVIGAANDNSVATGLTVVDIPDYYNTTTWKICQTMSIAVNPSTTTQYNWRYQFGVYNQTGAISQLNILGGTGSSFTSGTYILYGIK